jgi:putative peptidoglycan lipid II flippase
MKDQMARSAGIIALGNVTSRLLGLVRDQVTAGLFGRSGGTDAFFVASNISQVFYDLLIQGAVSSALVPVFSGYAGESQRARLWRLASLVLNLVIIVLSLVVLLLQVVRLAGAGFSPDVQQLATGLTRVTLLSVIFLGSSAVLTSLLYAQQDFVFPAFCSALFNGCIIVTAALFHERLGVGSLAAGMLLGSIAQVLFQLPPLARRQMTYALSIDFHDPDLRRIVLLYAPVAAGLVVSGVQTLIDRNLASRTAEGSISAMQYATRLIQFPLGLIPTAIAGASLPLLAQRAGEPALFRQTLGTGLRLITFLILPAATGLAILAHPIIAALFQHGAFGADDTQLTALALLLYLPGLPAAAVDQMLIFAFYAHKDTLTPVVVGVAATGVYLIVALALIGSLGMAGLVIANSAQWISHAIIILALLWRRMGSLGGVGLARTVLRSAVVCVVMAIAMITLVWVATPLLGEGLVANGLLVLLGVAVGLAVYVGAAIVLRMEELQTVLGGLRRR